MAKLTILFGILIAAVSAGFYFVISPHETAALHPAGIGVLLVLCGALAITENPKRRMLWMHIAVTLGLISLLTTGIRAIISLAEGSAMTINRRARDYRPCQPCLRDSLRPQFHRCSPYPNSLIVVQRKIKSNGKSRNI
jgi:hypothetical protein